VSQRWRRPGNSSACTRSVPLMQDAAQFKKWQWIEAEVEKAQRITAREPQIRVDNLQISGVVLSTAKDWAARRVWLDRLHLYTVFADLDGPA